MSNKRSTVSTGAFDALLIGTSTDSVSSNKLQPNRDKLQPNAWRKAKPKRKPPTKAAPARKDTDFPSLPPRPKSRAMLTLRFDPALLDRARNACHANNKTFQELIDSSLWHMTQTLEQQNGGKPYPPRPGKLKPGPRPAQVKT